MIVVPLEENTTLNLQIAKGICYKIRQFSTAYMFEIVFKYVNIKMYNWKFGATVLTIVKTSQDNGYFSGTMSDLLLYLQLSFLFKSVSASSPDLYSR